MILTGGRLYAPNSPGATAVAVHGRYDRLRRRRRRRPPRCTGRAGDRPRGPAGHPRLRGRPSACGADRSGDGRSRPARRAQPRRAAGPSRGVRGRQRPDGDRRPGLGRARLARCPRRPPGPSSTGPVAGGRSTWPGSTCTRRSSPARCSTGAPGISDQAGYRSDGLLSRDAHHLVRGLVNGLFTDADRRSAARRALTAVAAQGVATVHELGGPHLGPVEDLTRVREVGGRAGPARDDLLGRARDTGLHRPGTRGRGGRTGRGPVHRRGHRVADRGADAAVRRRAGAHTGARYLSDAEIADHIVACTRAGLQAGFHCIGDDAVAAAVAGFRRAAGVLGAEAIRAGRHRLEHVEMVAAADLDDAGRARCGGQRPAGVRRPLGRRGRAL